MYTSAASPRLSGNLTDTLTAAGAPLLFGVRLWASVCLALFVAFWLELDNPFWAGTSAAIVCQPQLGASLRKGWFRMIGTVVGAMIDRGADRMLSAGPDRLSRAPGAVGRCLRFRRHGAAQLRVLRGGARRLYRGDHRRRHPRRDRRRECAERLHAGGHARQRDLHRDRVRRHRPRRDRSRRRPAAAGSVIRRLWRPRSRAGFTRMLALAGPELPDTQPERRELVRRVIALDPVIDQALGESSHVRYHSPTLQTAVHGLFRALEGWRGVATHLSRLPDDDGSAGGGNHPAQHSARAAIGT